VSFKGRGRYRLHFHQHVVDTVRRDDYWLRTHFDGATVYGEQWYPVKIDNVWKKLALDGLGCTLVGRLNNVEVKKMCWLGSSSVDNIYGSLVIHVATKEEADRLVKEAIVNMLNGECAYLDNSTRQYSLPAATDATSTAMFITVVSPLYLSADSVQSRVMQRPSANLPITSVQPVEVRVHTRPRIQDALRTVGST
jgi:hypothetical protein